MTQTSFLDNIMISPIMVTIIELSNIIVSILVLLLPLVAAIFAMLYYRSSKKKRKSKEEIKRMNIQDLE